MSTAARTRTGTILVVDDDADFLLQMEITLRGAGYTVRRAVSLAEGRKALEAARPDAMVVDLMLEEQDGGFLLCYEAKKKYPGLPVIMVTGVARETGMQFDVNTAESRAWIKADRLLAKPVRMEQVLSDLDALLEA